MTHRYYWLAIRGLSSAILLILATSPALAITFSSANTDDAGTWSTVYAQGFRPSLDAMPDPGLGTGDAVTLDQFDFFKSGFADSAANIQLAIVDNLFYDYSTPLTTGSSSLLAVSANTVPGTAGIVTGDPISFQFNAVTLTYGTDYAAVFVNDDGSGTLTPIRVSALTENYVEDPPGSGIFVPASNYGNNDEFQYATSDFINGGFFSTYAFAGDAAFSATFSVVPEPAACVLSGWMALAMFALGRRR